MTLPTVPEMRNAMKAAAEMLVIGGKIDIVYKPTGTHFRALVAYPDDFPLDVESLPDDVELPVEPVFIEGGSQHGFLSLLRLPGEGKGYEHISIHGYYDRDRGTRNITAIYLPKGEINQAKYPGTLVELLKRDDVEIRPPSL